MWLFWLPLVASDEYEVIHQYNINANYPIFISIDLKRGEAFRIKYGYYLSAFFVATSSKKFYMNILNLHWGGKSRDYHGDEPGFYVFDSTITVEYVALESGVHTGFAGNAGSGSTVCNRVVAKDSISRWATVDYLGTYCYVQTNLEFPMKVTASSCTSDYWDGWVGLNKTDGTDLFYGYYDQWEGNLLQENVAVAKIKQTSTGKPVPVEIRSEGDGTRNFGTHRYDDMDVNNSQPPFYWKDANTKTRMKEGRYVPPPSPTRSPSASRSPTASASASQSPTASQSASASRSPTASASPSMSQSPTESASASRSPTASASASRSPTASQSPSKSLDHNDEDSDSGEGSNEGSDVGTIIGSVSGGIVAVLGAVTGVIKACKKKQKGTSESEKPQGRPAETAPRDAI